MQENSADNGIEENNAELKTDDIERVRGERFYIKSHFGERAAYALADYQSRSLSAVLFIVFFAVCAVFSISDGFLDGDVIFGVTMLVVAAVLSPLLYFFIRKTLRKSVIKNNAYYGCDCIASADDNTIYESVVKGGAEVAKSSYPVANVVKVADYKEFLFVYISKVQVIIIDKNKFEKGTVEEFKTFVASKNARVKKV